MIFQEKRAQIIFPVWLHMSYAYVNSVFDFQRFITVVSFI